jgi:hypothetical protein
VHPGTEKVHLDDIKGAPANAPESSLTIIESSIEPSARTRRASKRCPQEFQVDVDLLAWAASECPNVDAEAETQKFRDHEFKNARSDWAATWRNWIRGAKDRMGSANGKNGSSGSPRVSAVERVKRATDQWARERGIDPSTL